MLLYGDAVRVDNPAKLPTDVVFPTPLTPPTMVYCFTVRLLPPAPAAASPESRPFAAGR